MTEKPFACTFQGCNKKFARKDSLQLHFKTHTGEKSYICDVMVKNCSCLTKCEHEADTPCGKSFISSSHLNRHKKTHRDQFIHVCDICEAKYKKKSQLRQHKLDVHDIAEFLCEEEGCGRHFVSKAKLLIHQKSRHGGFMCPVITCSAIFPSNDSLTQHVATHDTNVTLIKRRPRKKNKPDNSEEQNLLEDTDFNLDDSIEMFYEGGIYCEDDEDDEYFVCNDDEDDDENDDDIYFIGQIKEGKRKRGRSLSMSSDQGCRTQEERRFKCPHPECDRSFSQKKNLDAHVKAIHSLTRPYPCPEPFCGQAFGFKSVLERHMLRCHGTLSVTDIPKHNASIQTPLDSCFEQQTDICLKDKNIKKARWNDVLGVNFSETSHV